MFCLILWYLIPYKTYTLSLETCATQYCSIRVTEYKPTDGYICNYVIKGLPHLWYSGAALYNI